MERTKAEFRALREAVGFSQHALVLPAFQFPSWYTLQQGAGGLQVVLPAFQFPSWYTCRTETAPASRGCFSFKQ